MPLLYHRVINQSEVAVWDTKEAMDFFQEQLILQDFPTGPVGLIPHPEKKLQWLASRYLLCQLYPAAIPLYAEGKPYLFGGPHISFSHSKNLVAVMVSEFNGGIDVQCYDPKIERISTKFIHSNDLECLRELPVNLIQKLTLVWTVKEAVFKHYGTNLPFKMIRVIGFEPESSTVTVRVESKWPLAIHQLHVKELSGAMLAYLLN